MEADENDGNTLHGSSTFKAASIFKNPFDVEKDQLIRQIFELPVRMAALVQSRRNQLGNSNADKTVSPFSICAVKLAAREDMGAGLSVSTKIDDMDWSLLNPTCQNKIDSTIEDGIEEPVTFGSKKRKRIEQSHATLSSLECTSKSSAEGNLCIDTISRNKSDAECQKPCKQLSMSANDELFSSQQDKNLAEKCMHATQKQAATPGSLQTAKETGQAAGKNEAVPDLPVSAIKMKPHDVAEFVIMVIRTLRHTRDSNMQKLFEILSVPDFPVDKCGFLEELIQQAWGLTYSNLVFGSRPGINISMSIWKKRANSWISQEIPITTIWCMNFSHS